MTRLPSTPCNDTTRQSRTAPTPGLVTRLARGVLIGVITASLGSPVARAGEADQDQPATQSGGEHRSNQDPAAASTAPVVREVCRTVRHPKSDLQWNLPGPRSTRRPPPEIVCTAR